MRFGEGRAHPQRGDPLENNDKKIEGKNKAAESGAGEQESPPQKQQDDNEKEGQE